MFHLNEKIAFNHKVQEGAKISEQCFLKATRKKKKTNQNNDKKQAQNELEVAPVPSICIFFSLHSIHFFYYKLGEFV